MRPKLLLLDMDDVLVDYRHDIRCRIIAEAAGCTPDYAHQALFESKLEFRCDRGELDLDTYLDLLRSDWGLSITTDDFIDARRQATRARESMLEICAQLAEQAQLAIFTNNADWMHEHIEKVVPDIAPLFRRRFVTSGTLKLAKPEEVAFRACLDRLGFSPLSSVFVDDKQINVDGAQRAGMDAFVFESIEQFTNELRRREFELELNNAH
jgi:glucose-1-phosphatase